MQFEEQPPFIKLWPFFHLSIRWFLEGTYRQILLYTQLFRESLCHDSCSSYYNMIRIDYSL